MHPPPYLLPPPAPAARPAPPAADWHAGVGDGFALPDMRVRGLARCAKPKDAETGGVGSATPDVEEETWHRFWSEPDYDGGKFGNDPPDDTIAPDDDDGNALGTRPT